MNRHHSCKCMGRSILVKWTNPHTVQVLSNKRGELSWLSHVTFRLLQVNAVYCYSISPPLPSRVGNGLSRRVSSFNPGLCGSRQDKALAGLACVITGSWLVLLGSRGGCDDVPQSVVHNAGALFSSFPSSSSGVLEGLRCGVTEASSFLRNLRFRKVILPDSSTLFRYCLWGRVSMTWPVVLYRPLFVRCIDTICPFKSKRSV